MKKTSLEEIMSTTKIGEIVALKEIETNTYVRKRNCLKRISSVTNEIMKISNRHQCQ